MKITIISPDMIRLDKKLNRLKKEIPTKLSTAMKIAANAGRDSLRKNTRKRFSGTLKESYVVKKNTGAIASYSVRISEGVRSRAISNREKFRYYDLGRSGFSQRKKKLYIPLNSKAYKAYTKGNIAGLKSMKHGVDFVWARRVKASKANRISGKAKRESRRVFKTRINSVVNKNIFRI